MEYKGNNQYQDRTQTAIAELGLSEPPKMPTDLPPNGYQWYFREDQDKYILVPACRKAGIDVVLGKGARAPAPPTVPPPKGYQWLARTAARSSEVSAPQIAPTAAFMLIATPDFQEWA